MGHANELSIFEGADTWGAVKKAATLALARPAGTLTADEATDLAGVQAEMQRIENRA